MAKPIYKLFMFRNTEAYYQASQNERDEFLGKLDEAFKRVGEKRIVACDSSWSSEEWPVFGVEVFPDIEAVQAYSQAMQELNMARYVVSTTILGTEFASE